MDGAHAQPIPVLARDREIDALAATLFQTFEQEDVTFFVGAGISLEAPANLPNANDLKWQILDALAGHPASAEDRPLLQQYLDTHMLELLVQDLKETLGSGVADVFDVFRGGDPNPYHRLIARLAKRKLVRRVITTNFDCLIERALADEGVEYHALTTEHDFAEAIVRPENCPAFHVIKLHGTVAFTDGGREIPGRRDVRAVSPLKLDMRKLVRYLKDQGLAVSEHGFERTVSAKETLIGSLDRLGLSLSEVTAELLVKHLEKSTVIVIGWNGFDLDIAPLFVKHAAKVIWLVHDSPSDDDDRRRREICREIDNARQNLRSRGLGETETEMILLAHTLDYSLDVLPTPEKERAQVVARSPESKQVKVFTPVLIRSLWCRIEPKACPVPASARENPSAEPRTVCLTIGRWSDSLAKDLPLRWALGRLFLHHGEYESTQKLLEDVVEAITGEGPYDVAAMLQLDLGDLNAIYGNRVEAVQAYEKAIRLRGQAITRGRQQPRVIDRFHLAQIAERARFGIGEIACEFYDFGAAARAFGQMEIDSAVVRALVHYCREEFSEANRLFSTEIRFVRLGGSRFHHYLYYFLKLLDARIHWLNDRFDLAATEFQEVVTTATKLGLPRLQVQALNGLALTYSTHVRRTIDSLGRADPYYDNLKAAKCAAQSIAIANQAEYRCGRAHAGYYMGVIYADVGLHVVAASALRYSEGLFARLGHSAGLDFCRQAKAQHHLVWESGALSQWP
jgi:tetratricopeptide (TPR) repeat protein